MKSLLLYPFSLYKTKKRIEHARFDSVLNRLFVTHTHTHARLIELYGKSRYQSPIERKASNKSKEHKREIIDGK